MAYIFPNWIEYLEEIFSDKTKKKYAFSNALKLSELLGKLEFLKKNVSILKTDPAKLAELLISQGRIELGFTEIEEDQLIENLKHAKLGNDEFIVIGNPSSHNFIKVDDRIKEVLNIEPSAFNLARICGLDFTHELFHPEDIPHVLRVTSYIIVVASLDGFQVDPYKDYFRVQFRIGYSDDANKLTIERKIYLSSKVSEENIIHFDIWRITHDWHSFEGVTATFESPEEGKRNFLSVMIYILNAMELGFSPKDLLFITIINNHKSNKAQLKSINQLFRDKVNATEDYLTDSQFKHLKRYVNQKIENAILLQVHPLADLETLKNTSLNFKATQLGLLKRPPCFEEILLQFIKKESGSL